MKIVASGDNPEWQKWAARYKHEGRGIPILYVIRSDGEMLYGKSGALSGDNLPSMMQDTLRHAGQQITAEQHETLASRNKLAETAMDESDFVSAARTLGANSDFGTLTMLGSFAEPAVKSDDLSKQVQDECLRVINDAVSRLDDSKTSLLSLIEIYDVLDAAKEFPAVRETGKQLKRRLKSNKSLTETIKHAQAISKARSLVASGSSSKRRQAIKSYNNLIVRNSGTQVATVAMSELRELDAGSADDAAKKAKTEANSSAAETTEMVAEFREWKDKSGSFSVTARLVKVENGIVSLVKKDGEKLEVELSRFSESDQRYIAKDRN